MVSPRTRKVDLLKSRSFLVYCITDNFFSSCLWSTISPLSRCITISRYDSGAPNPYIDETVATTIASFLSINALVADNRICSICSLIDASLAMYVSEDGT